MTDTVVSLLNPEIPLPSEPRMHYAGCTADINGICSCYFVEEARPYFLQVLGWPELVGLDKHFPYRVSLPVRDGAIAWQNIGLMIALPDEADGIMRRLIYTGLCNGFEARYVVHDEAYTVLILDRVNAEEDIALPVLLFGNDEPTINHYLQLISTPGALAEPAYVRSRRVQLIVASVLVAGLIALIVAYMLSR